MRIALFTPYSPEIGGGSVQLRSHLAQIPDLLLNGITSQRPQLKAITDTGSANRFRQGNLPSIFPLEVVFCRVPRSQFEILSAKWMRIFIGSWATPEVTRSPLKLCS